MTWRAILIGLVGAVTLCCITYFNQSVMRQSAIVGNYIPLSVYGTLILFVVVLNPLLRRIRPSWQLSGRELAVSLTLVLAACGIAESGFLKTFNNVLMLPHHYRLTTPSWDHEETGTFDRLPTHMLAGPPPWYDGADVLDVRTAARTLAATGGASDALRHVRKFVDEAERARLAAALAASTVAPDEAERAAAAAALDDAIARRDARVVAKGNPQYSPLDAEERSALHAAVAAAFGLPTAESPGSHEVLLQLKLLLAAKGFKKAERAIVTDVVESALGEIERPARDEVVVVLNGLLRRTEIYDAAAFSGVRLPRLATKLGVSALDEDALARFDRQLVDLALGACVRSLDTEENTAVAGYLQGLSVGDESISLGDVPWDAWMRPFLTWVPLALLLIVAFVALALVVHRQWSEHENLPYPIATFAASLLEREGEGRTPVLRQRAFWIATAVVLFIHLVNFAHSWWPRYMINIPTSFNFWSISELTPTFQRGRLAWNILQFRLYFAVIGVAYLVSSDVSFSFAFVPIVGTIIDGVLVGYGVSFMEGGEHRASIYTSLNIGSFIAFVAMVGYFGRRFYWSVLRAALGLRPTEEVRPHEVWGMRVFLGCSVTCTGLMIACGLAWPFAILYMFMVFVFYVGVSRVVAETGLFIMKTAWVPHILLLGLFGGFALGPTAAIISMVISAVLFAEARETVMPYMVNSFHLLEREGEGPSVGRIACWGAAAAMIGLVVGLVVTLCIQHDRGTDMAASEWFTWSVPRYPYEISTSIAQRLKSQGSLEASDALPSWRRLFAMRPETKFWISFVVGAALVIGSYVGRLRVKGWPIHPAVFLLWSWWHCSKLVFSFAVGWAIKAGVTKYGGWSMVQKVRPVMIGLIAGDMLGAFVPALISALYYFVTGEPPQSYDIMP